MFTKKKYVSSSYNCFCIQEVQPFGLGVGNLQKKSCPRVGGWGKSKILCAKKTTLRREIDKICSRLVEKE